MNALTPKDCAMTDTQNVIAPETVANTIVREVAELSDRTSPEDQPNMMLVSETELNNIVLAALHRQPAQAPTYEKAIRALEDIALLDAADGHLLKWEHAWRAVAIAASTLKKHPSQIHSERQQTAPGQAFGRPIAQPPAQGVTEEIVNRAHSTNQRFLSVNTGMDFLEWNAMKAALQAALHPTPAPAQGVTVTDEAVNRAMLAVQSGCDITPREMRRALQAALHPAEE